MDHRSFVILTLTGGRNVLTVNTDKRKSINLHSASYIRLHVRRHQTIQTIQRKILKMVEISVINFVLKKLTQ
jgi:hypothetical protein